MIIGVTNPFFTKCLQHWPSIIKVADINKNVQFEPQGNFLINNYNQLIFKSLETIEKSQQNKNKKFQNNKLSESKPGTFNAFS